jgi:hypothetical protein
MAENGFTAVWSGIAELSASLNKAVAGADDLMKEIVAKSGAIVEREAKQNFQGSHKKGAPHVGGDLPNVVTGDLRASIYPSEVMREGNDGWSLTIGPRKEYGRRVELGYSGSGKGRGQQTTRPFPYFDPAVRSAMPKIQELNSTMLSDFFGRA